MQSRSLFISQLQSFQWVVEPNVNSQQLVHFLGPKIVTTLMIKLHFPLILLWCVNSYDNNNNRFSLYFDRQHQTRVSYGHHPPMNRLIQFLNYWGPPAAHLSTHTQIQSSGILLPVSAPPGSQIRDEMMKKFGKCLQIRFSWLWRFQVVKKTSTTWKRR